MVRGKGIYSSQRIMQILSDMFLILISNELNTKRKLSAMPWRHYTSFLPLYFANAELLTVEI